MARKDVAQILRKYLEKEEDPETIASCLFAYYVTSVLIHILPEEGTPPLDRYLSYLPVGQRVVRDQYAGACRLSEGRICQSAGNGADSDGNDRKNLSDPDDLSVLCGSHVSDQSERSGAQDNR